MSLDIAQNPITSWSLSAECKQCAEFEQLEKRRARRKYLAEKNGITKDLKTGKAPGKLRAEQSGGCGGGSEQASLPGLEGNWEQQKGGVGKLGWNQTVYCPYSVLMNRVKFELYSVFGEKVKKAFKYRNKMFEVII